MTTIPFSQTRERLMADPEFRKKYESLEAEFSLVEVMIEARTRAGMSQADVARAMGVSQPRVARIESGKNVSFETLKRYAQATGSKVKIGMEPLGLDWRNYLFNLSYPQNTSKPGSQTTTPAKTTRTP